jgi:hypothetical protein
MACAMGAGQKSRATLAKAGGAKREASAPSANGNGIRVPAARLMLTFSGESSGMASPTNIRPSADSLRPAPCQWRA